MMSGCKNIIGEIKQAITKLTNGKAPRSNEVPPDAFKALNMENLAILNTLYLTY